MNAGIERRLARLEGGAKGHPFADVAAIIKAGRERVLSMTPEEWQAEQSAKLAEMERQHAEQPFRGLMLRILEGRRRAHGPHSAEVRS